VIETRAPLNYPVENGHKKKKNRKDTNYRKTTECFVGAMPKNVENEELRPRPRHMFSAFQQRRL
jgi:hypothetical protein